MHALITGPSRGIGLAIAKKLLDSHIKTRGLSRSAPAFDHPLFSHYRSDFNELMDLEKQLKEWKKTWEPFDFLILNAGKGQFGHIEEWKKEDIEELFRVNSLAPILIAKAFLPAMKKRKSGKIIFIGSESALTAKKEGSIYSATKFALKGFADALRDECRSSGISVTTIHPGLVKTPFFDNLSFKPGEGKEEHLLPEDVAEAVMFSLTARNEIRLDEIVLSPQKGRITK